MEWIENRPGTDVTPGCVAIEKYDLTARVKFQGHATPVVRGTSDTLTYTLEQFDGGTGTIALANMLAGAAGWDFDSQPHSESQEFKYKGTTMTPFTVSM